LLGVGRPKKEVKDGSLRVGLVCSFVGQPKESILPTECIMDRFEPPMSALTEIVLDLKKAYKNMNHLNPVRCEKAAEAR
jgi:hypothetical protein